MNREFFDKLLDEGLKNYSRVDAPDDLAERVRARAAQPAPRRRPWWVLAPAPIAAAAVLAFVLLRPQPSEVPPPPPLTAEIASPALAPAAPKVVIRANRSKTRVQPRGPRPLSPEELASVRLPAGLFPSVAPPDELVIPEITVSPLESEITPRSNDADKNTSERDAGSAHRGTRTA